MYARSESKTYLQLLLDLVYTQLPHWYTTSLTFDSSCSNIPGEYSKEDR